MNARLLARTCSLLAVVMVLFCFRSLVLAGGLRVVLIGPAPDDPIVARMRDELLVLGIEVEVMTPREARDDLAAVARGHEAAAVARIESSPPEVVLWVEPARSGAGPAAGVELRVSEWLPGNAEPALLSLRAVELLRGRLIPVPPSQAEASDAASVDAAAPPASAAPPAASAAPRVEPRPPPASAAPPARRPEPPPSGALAFFLAPAVLLSPGGLSAMPQVRLGAQWNPTPRLGIETMAFLPTTAATASAAEGTTDLRIVDLGAGVRGLFTEPDAAWSLSTGLGLGAMLLLFEGVATGPWIGQSGERWVASPYAALGAGYRLGPRVSLRFDALTTLVRPEPVVRIASRRVASFGQPAVFLAFGVELRP